MAKMADVYGGKFIKATPSGFIGMPDLPEDCEAVVLTIKGRLNTKEFEDGNRQQVAKFVETDMEFGFNMGNWNAVAIISGKDDDDYWDGTQIELFVIPFDKSDSKHAIRVRKPRANTFRYGKGKAAAKPAAKEAADEAPMGVDVGVRILSAIEERGKSLAELAGILAIQNPDNAGLSSTPLANWPARLFNPTIAKIIGAWPKTTEVTDARKSAIRSMLETELEQAKSGTPYLSEDDIPF